MHTLFVRLQRLDKVMQAATLVVTGNLLHGLDLCALVAQRNLARHDGLYVLDL